jgi:CheY-like chemotaxis protein
MGRDKQGKTILVVDDEAVVGAVVKHFLETAGYAVLLAGDAKVAINLYLQHQATVALLLTDVRMPSMSGPDLADYVLRLEPQLPVLFMSGSDWSLSRGFGCVAKPFKQAELVRRVGEALACQRSPVVQKTEIAA